MGRISATGSPRYETVMVMPSSRTCLSSSENRAFASYVEYVAAMQA